MTLIRFHIYPLLVLLVLPACTTTDSVYNLDPKESNNWGHQVREKLDRSDEAQPDGARESNSVTENQVPRLTRDGIQQQDLVKRALAENNAIREARERWKAAVQTARVESGFPDPELMSMVAVEPIQTRDGPIDWQAKLMQRFPWFGTLEAKEKRQLANAGRAYARYHRKRISVRENVKQQFAEFRYLHEAAEVVDDMGNYLKRMEESVREAYEAGEAPVHDLLRVQNDHEKIQIRGKDLRDRQRAVRARLNQFLDRPTEAPLGKPDDSSLTVPELNENTLREALMSHRPELDEALFREEAARQDLRFASRSFYPDFSVGVSYSGVGDSDQRGTVDAGSDAYGVLFTMDLPLWQEKRKARMHSARAKKRSARMQFADERSRGFAELSGVLAKLREVERQIALHQETTLPNAERSLSSAREEYESGDMDIVSFLDFQNRLLMARLDLHRSRAKRRKTVAELESVIGMSLDQISKEK